MNVAEGGSPSSVVPRQLRWRGAWFVLLLASLAAEPVGAGYVVVASLPLPQELDTLGEVRTATAESVFVAAARQGTWEVFLDGRTPRKVVPGAGEVGGFWLHSYLAASVPTLVVASSFGSFTWLDRRSGLLAAPFPFDVMVDVDVDRDGRRVALLGARRDDEGAYAPDGAMAWIGTLDGRLSDLKAMLFSQSGEGSPAMNRCHFLDLGRVRYLADGNLLVIPGVEGGAYLYTPAGRLIHAWEASDLDLEDGCGLSEEEGLQLAAEWRLRYSTWLNQHRVLDDLVPLAAGPGLLIRTREGDTTRWRLRTLREGGPSPEVELPVTSPSPYAHLRADVTGEDRLVVLLKETHDVGAAASIEQRVLVLEARP